MYIVVTGAAGFIGSHLVKALNARGISDIIAVDNLKHGAKFSNLVEADIAHYVDKQDFIELIDAGDFDGEIDAILHQGACTDPQEQDGQYLMDNNYQYSLALLDYCQAEEIPFIYASSAAVYGNSVATAEVRGNESPRHIAGYSKFLFDQIVRRRGEELTAQVVGLRYFNVYGPHEAHKQAAASPVWQHYQQYQLTGRVQLPADAGSLDCITVADVVAANLHFLDRPAVSDIFNLGSGETRPMAELATITINACRRQQGKPPLTLPQLLAEGTLDQAGEPMPAVCQAAADLAKLRASGYQAPFIDPQAGINAYVDWLGAQH